MSHREIQKKEKIDSTKSKLDTIIIDKKLDNLAHTEDANKKNVKVYPLEHYNVTKDFIKNGFEMYSVEKLCDILSKKDKGYHLRVHSDQNYIFFGDVDNYKGDMDTFTILLISFMDEYYNVIIKEEDIKHTQNHCKNGSYHYSIPSLFCSCKKLKEIHTNFLRIYKDEFVYAGKNKIEKCIDTTIYSEHWFRYPNQAKNGNTLTKHVIMNGAMKDFIVEYIPHNSVSIEDKQFIQKITKENNNTKVAVNTNTSIVISKDNTKNNTNGKNNGKTSTDETKKVIKQQKPKEEKPEQQPNTNDEQIKQYVSLKTHSQFQMYLKFFNKCFKEERFNTYGDWITVGMALKNIYGDMAFSVFDYFSSKAKNYDGTDETRKKYASFNENYEKGYSIASIYWMAQEDNLTEYIKIMYSDDLPLEDADICIKIKELAGDRFIYKRVGEANYRLYCFNGRYWECDSMLLGLYITTELFKYYYDLITSVYKNSPFFSKYKHRIDRLKNSGPMNSIIQMYNKFGINSEIEFDDKFWLLGFTNKVYDLQKGEFRDYKFDDYISITTGYDWIEPTDEEINLINELVNQIMPIEDERNLYKQILSTSLEGRPLENFIIFNGRGGNGKGMIDDILLLGLGDYAIVGNNSILFEKNRTGSNPEKANLDKKRLIIFREPPEKSRFENSIVKELTGGGVFSARTHLEKTTKKILHGTIIVECNKRPLFAEEPTEADSRRLIDILFRAYFTSDVSLLSDEDYIYKANKLFKTKQFQEKHKRALLKILMEAYKKYQMNNYDFNIPKYIQDRTTKYLEMSCNILQWFKDKYEFTKNKNDIVKMKDVYAVFKISDYYYNLSKADKRKYNYSYFLDYFQNNMQFRKYYVLRRNDFTNFLQCCKHKANEEDEQDEEDEQVENDNNT